MTERTPVISISLADPRTPELTMIIRELDRELEALYPAESNHLVDIDTLAQPTVKFFGVSVDRECCGCGAILLYTPEYAEIKRVFVRPARRGLGLGRRLLQTLEEEARRASVHLLRLETGTFQPEALALFEHAGFVRCGPFGDYPANDPYSVFMEKRL